MFAELGVRQFRNQRIRQCLRLGEYRFKTNWGFRENNQGQRGCNLLAHRELGETLTFPMKLCKIEIGID